MTPEDQEGSSVELSVDVLALASTRARFYLTRCQPHGHLSKCRVNNFDLCALPGRTFSEAYRIPGLGLGFHVITGTGKTPSSLEGTFLLAID